MASIVILEAERQRRLAAAASLPESDGKRNGDLKWALDTIRNRLGPYQLTEDYYKGEHRLAYATDKWTSAFGRIFRTFAANYCPTVVDAVADRLALTGVVASQGKTPRQELIDVMTAAWERNNLALRSNHVHASSLRNGESYAIVWPHPVTEQATIYLNRMDKVCVRYSEETPGEIEIAAKVWLQRNGQSRITLYYRDRIEKWIHGDPPPDNKPRLDKSLPTSITNFRPAETPGEEWPVFHELGRIPVVAFPNNAIEGETGRSELADVIPLQDALNVSIMDMLVAMEFAAYPQRWAVGLEMPRNPETGKEESPFQSGIERLWTSPDPTTQFGQFATAELMNFVRAQDAFRSDIARVSKTPLHHMLLTGQFPSGPSQRAAEAPLMAKVKDRQGTFGNAWEAVFTLVLIEEGRLQIEEAEELVIDATWDDTTSVDLKELVETILLKRDAGISEQQGLRELGYDEDEIAKMVDEKSGTAAVAADNAQRDFDAGELDEELPVSEAG